MKNFLTVQSSIQDIAEAIKSILSIDVTIINNELRRIAATGIYESLIGEKLPKGCSYDYILQTKNFEYITYTQINKRCRQCKLIKSCKEISSIGYPILSSDNEVHGVLGLIAFTLEQQNYIQNNYKNISNFLLKLSDLMSERIKYEEISLNLSLKTQEINTIINASESGIILTDKNFQIKSYNEKAKKFLNIDPTILLENYKISDFFPIKTTISPQNLSLLNVKKSQKREFLFNIKVNKINEKVESYLFQFSPYSNNSKNTALTVNNKQYIGFSNIIGKSDAIKNTISIAKQIAPSESSVLIRGESGTGKEIFARSIHNESLRKNHPFIAINCAAIPDHLLESELFGYEKGAFTGANISGKIGKFELANGGTLFLDEIGEMPLHLQPKLLRVLQEGTFSRVGGSRLIKVNFRLISATNCNLEESITNNTFREDLYYRLNVIPIIIPPLRSRKEDIPLLAEEKLKDICKKLDRPLKILSPELMDKLKTAYWRGNVRELENVIEYLVNISQSTEIKISDLPVSFYQSEFRNHTDKNYHLNPQKNLREQIDFFEKNLLLSYLNYYGTSTKQKKQIAKLLQINLSTLYRKLYYHNLI